MALYDTARIPGLHKTVFSMTQSLQKFFQIMWEGESIILKKTFPNFVLTRTWQTTVEKTFYWPPISTIIQTVPLFCYPIIKIHKVSQPWRRKGWLSRNNNRKKKLEVQNIHISNLHTNLRLVPSQDVPFALILWYVARIIY